jgi:hypothetical protein
VPAVPTAGVPERIAVPLGFGVNVTPLGKAPDSVRVGAGIPVVVTLKVPGLPTTNVVLEALVMAGAELTVRLNDWVAAVPTLLVAVIVKVYGVAEATIDEDPVRVPLPAPLSWKLNPAGRVDVESVGDGEPVAVTLNVNGTPDTSETEFGLVMAGGAGGAGK